MSLSLIDAAYHTVHAYPGGAEALAPRLYPKKAPITLNHELRPPEGSTAKLGLETAAQIVDLTGNASIVHAFAARAGGLFVPLPYADDESRATVLAGVGVMAREFSDLVGTITTSAADGSISLNELRRIERDAIELMKATQNALRIIREIHEGH